MQKLKIIYQRTSRQTQNKLQEIFDTFSFTTENIYNIADNKTKKRINTYIEQWKEQGLLKNNNYFTVLANNIYRRIRVKNSEILELLIYSAYIEEQNKLEEQEKQIMYEDANYYYEQGQQEVTKKKKPSILEMALFLALLDQPNYSGFNWKQYIETTMQYNAQQIYKQAILNIQQQKGLEIDSSDFQTIMSRQNNQKLNINGDKISGAVDMQMIGLNNLAKVEGIESVAEDNSKVRFIAVEDEKTTLMCDSLNNKEFYINKENVFDRYYGENQKELTVQRIRCNGLVLGLNLPPIQHHFHYCRSTIVYNSNYMSKDFRNGNVLGEEQYESLKQYLKSMSYKINSKLYSNNKLSEDDKEYIQNLDEVLKGMPIYKGWVKRSVCVRDSKDVSNILSIFNNEQRIGHWNSYISSSLGIYDTSFKMIMKIKSKTGRNLATLNDEGGGEILFMRNTDFQLIDIKNKNGIIYVKLEEL
jgi:hypothetical protein